MRSKADETFSYSRNINLSLVMLMLLCRFIEINVISLLNLSPHTLRNTIGICLLSISHCIYFHLFIMSIRAFTVFVV